MYLRYMSRESRAAPLNAAHVPIVGLTPKASY